MSLRRAESVSAPPASRCPSTLVHRIASAGRSRLDLNKSTRSAASSRSVLLWLMKIFTLGEIVVREICEDLILCRSDFNSSAASNFSSRCRTFLASSNRSSNQLDADVFPDRRLRVSPPNFRIPSAHLSNSEWKTCSKSF